MASSNPGSQGHALGRGIVGRRSDFPAAPPSSWLGHPVIKDRITGEKQKDTDTSTHAHTWDSPGTPRSSPGWPEPPPPIRRGGRLREATRTSQRLLQIEVRASYADRAPVSRHLPSPTRSGRHPSSSDRFLQIASQFSELLLHPPFRKMTFIPRGVSWGAMLVRENGDPPPRGDSGMETPLLHLSFISFC